MILKVIKIYNNRWIKKHFTSSILDTSDINLTMALLSLGNYFCNFKLIHSEYFLHFILSQTKIILDYFDFKCNSFLPR